MLQCLLHCSLRFLEVWRRWQGDSELSQPLRPVRRDLQVKSVQEAVLPKHGLHSEAETLGPNRVLFGSLSHRVICVVCQLFCKRVADSQDYEWRTIQWKLWFYGLLDDSNVRPWKSGLFRCSAPCLLMRRSAHRLANEVMLASQVRSLDGQPVLTLEGLWF